jgi:hypothetical protein
MSVSPKEAAIDAQIFTPVHASNKTLQQSNTLTIGKSKQSLFSGRLTSLFILDNSIVDAVAEYGIPHEALIRYLNNNELNSATTCYYLLQLPDIREECRKLEEKKAREQ